MSQTLQTNQVLYVEPNLITDTTAYDEMTYGKVYKTPSHEDFCVVVDLEVEVKGRTYNGSKNGNSQNLTLEWTSSTQGERVNFMQGSKIQTKSGGSINSLTTSYTDIHLRDIENRGTAEMFGIKSIDISYNNFMVPEVTIQFVDVRGVSLFAQEELRHNVVSNGITATVNNDIEGSFFKCFFTFPYPKFTLKVKGYYGKMTSYELTCSDFRAAFDSNTGNFNVTARFLGYAFSFLNDVMVNALVSAPYSEYIGKEYWESQLDKTFTVENANGADVPMPTLGEICKEYKSIVEQSDAELADESKVSEYREKYGSIPEQSTKIDPTVKNEVTKLFELYNVKIGENIAEIVAKFQTVDRNGNIAVKPGTSNTICLIAYDDNELGARFIKEVNEFNTALRDCITQCRGNCKELRDWVAQYGNLEVKKYAYDDIVDKAGNFLKDCFTEESLRSTVQKLSAQPVESDMTGATFKDNWEGGFWPEWKSTTYFYIYEDHDLGNLLTSTNTSFTSGSTIDEQEKDMIRQKVIQENFAGKFGFYPTVENVTKTIMAHLETYVHMVTHCSDAIIDSGQERSVSNLGVSLSNFPDAQGNNATSSESNIVVAPFPKVTKRVPQDGVEKDEDTWIGEFGDSQKFEEIALIEGILNGITQAGGDINYASPESINSVGPANTSSIKNPLTYMDLFMGPNDNIFGNDIQFNQPNDIFSRFCVRANAIFSTYTGETYDSSAISFGELDAENFITKYQSESSFGRLKEILKSSTLTGEELFKFCSHGKVKPDNGNGVPWPGNGGILTERNGKCVFNLGCHYVGNDNKTLKAIPVKNWTFVSCVNDFRNKKLLVPNSNQSFYTYQRGFRSNVDLLSCLVIDNALNYIKLNVDRLRASGFYSTSLDDYFGDLKIDVDTYGKEINNFIHLFENDKSTGFDVSKLINEEGTLNLTDDYFAQLPCFTNKEYYNDNIYKRASFFLENLYDNTQKKQYREGHIESILTNNDRSITFMPKIKALYIASLIYDDKIGSNINFNYKQRFIKYFEEWVESKYIKYDRDFSLPLKVSGSYGTFFTLLKHNPNKERILECFNSTDFYLKYKDFNLFNGTISTTAKPSKEMKDMLNDLLSVSCICLTTCHNNNNNPSNKAISNSTFINYFTGVLNGLRKLLNVEVNDTSDSTSVSISINGDSDDIKVGVYNYVKMLYDKWIASGDTLKSYNMNTMFNNSDHTFHFIDSLYNRIGKSIFLNVGTLVDAIIKCQTNTGYTLLSLLSDLYSSNKFIFLCIQNFIDLSKMSNMEQMFKPIPYIDIEKPDNHPDFVVLYAYEASSKLDVSDSDYPDDTFYLNEATTWPIMISSKQPGDMAIPAFGVTYGQQYQNYFKNIQVDMSAPMSTEQSIKAKFMISGALSDGQNNGTRAVTIGQDLYTIYSNNSYTCKVTMMGCAWVQPMMYFVLQNVPMFRGSYLICKVNHQIGPGQMTTTFTGVRMAKTATRSVKNYVLGFSNDSSEGSTDQITPMANFSNVSNDCDWASYDPTANNIVDGTVIIDANPQVMQRDKYLSEDAIKKCSARFNNPTGLLNQKNIEEGNPKGYWKYDNFTAGFKATASLMLTYLSGRHYKSKQRNPTVLDICSVWILGKTVRELSSSELIKITTEAKKRAKSAGLAYNQKLPINLTVLIRLCMGFALWETGYYNRKEATDGATEAFNEYKSNRGQVDELHNDTEIISPKKKMEAFASGFTQAVESSLRASANYRNVTVKMDSQHEGWLRLSAHGVPNGNNALFDCIAQTYQDWWDGLSFGCNANNSSSEPYGVHVHIVNKKPANNKIYVYSKDRKETIQLTQESDVNEGLRSSMIKFFRSKNITKPATAKACFRSILNMSDDNVSKIFELGVTSGSSHVKSCSSLSGGFKQELLKTGKKFPNIPDNIQSQHIEETAMMLQSIQDYYGKKIRVTSGFRSKSYNASVIGSDTSAHVLGWAADIQPTDMSDMRNLQKAVLKWAQHNNFDQIIIENPTNYVARWIHVGYKGNGGCQRKQLLYKLKNKSGYPRLTREFYLT